MNKKLFTAVSVSAVMAICTAAAFAQDISVTVNGNAVEFDQPPVIDNDRTLVPMRAIFEALGAEVEWNQETQTVTSTKDNTSISLTIGSDKMTVATQDVTLDVPAKIISDRTMVPVRAISEALACKVDWNGDTQTVIITADTAVPTETSAPAVTSAPSETSAPAVTSAPAQTAAPSETSAPTPMPATVDIKEGVNFFTDEGILEKTLIKGTTGELSENKTFYTTDYIAINAGLKYYGGMFNPQTSKFNTIICVNCAFYDKDKKFISGIDGDMSKIVTAPYNAAYMRFSIKVPSIRYLLYIDLEQTDTAPTEFTKSAAVKAAAKTTKFEGKKIYLIGDNQVVNGDKWAYLVDKELNPDIMSVKCSNGLYFTNPGNNKNSWNSTEYLSSIAKDADYVIICSGFVDWAANYYINTRDMRSGGIYDLVNVAEETFKTKNIAFMTIPYGKNFADGFTEGGYYNALGLSTKDYSDTIKDAASMKNYPVIDVSDLWTKENITDYLIPDNLTYVYPNDAGSRLMADTIVSRMIEIAGE